MMQPPTTSCLLSVLCGLLFPLLPLPAGAAEILAINVIHDARIDPPGCQVELTLRFPPEQREATLELAVARLTRADPVELEMVKSSSDTLRDREGNYRQAVVVRAEPMPGARPGVVTRKLVIAYRDLALAPGGHTIGVQARLSGPDFKPVLAISDLVRVTKR
jgi:hypothetical protein